MEDDTKLAELEKRHGIDRVLRFRLNGKRFYFAVPTQADHERYAEKIQDDKTAKCPALREYVLSSLVDPAREELIAAFEQYPGIPDSIGMKLLQAARGGIELEEKKQ